MNWDYEYRSMQTRSGDTREYVVLRKQIRGLHLHVERNFPHGQGWLSSVSVSGRPVPNTGMRVKLSLGGYRLGNPVRVKRYPHAGKRNGIVHISVLDLTLTIIRSVLS